MSQTHDRLTFERLVALSERERRQRARDMETAKEALEVAWRGWKRLQDLGFADACYCPKDGTPFEVVEWGATGIFRCTYSGKWPDGHYLVEDAGDIWPTSRGGMLWRPIPAGYPAPRTEPLPPPKVDPRRVNHCHADRDGDCQHVDCPQLRDNEPETSGRHCPLDVGCPRCCLPDADCEC